MSHQSGHMIAANSKRLFKNLGVENYINHKLCAYLTWDPYIDQTLKILSLCLRTPIFTKPNLCNLEVFFQYIFVYILPFPIKVHNMFVYIFPCPIKVLIWQFDHSKIKTNLMNSPPESSHPDFSKNIIFQVRTPILR